MRTHRQSHRARRRGHSLVETLVALTVFAVGALGAAALFAHAAHRLARAAQLAHTRDVVRARRAFAASAACDPFAKGVLPLTLAWTDSLSGAITLRADGAPCAQ